MNYSRLDRNQGLQEATTPPNPKGDDGVAFLAGKSTGGREDMTVLRRNLREGRRGDTQSGALTRTRAPPTISRAFWIRHDKLPNCRIKS